MNFIFNEQCQDYGIKIIKKQEYFHVYVQENKNNEQWLSKVGQIIKYEQNYYILKTDNPYKFYFEYYYHFQ